MSDPLDILDDFDRLCRDPAKRMLIRTGQTMGCFYIESPAMRSLFARMKCETYEDVVAASSIIRPGVAESGMMKEFILRARDPGRVRALHPKMAELLKETYGVMVYQEDVIKVAHEIGGLTLAEADLLRRAMSGKMRSRDAMEKLTERFFESCRKKGIDEKVAREIWRQIESFAGYSFCKGHSASFAVLSFQMTYLKAHHPAEFMASVLANGGGFYQPAAYVSEARRMGLRVLPPSVNPSTGSGQAPSGSSSPALNAVEGSSTSTPSDSPTGSLQASSLTQRRGVRRGDSGTPKPPTRGPGAQSSLASIANGSASSAPLREIDDASQLDYTGHTEKPLPPDDPPPGRRSQGAGWIRVGFRAIKNFPEQLAQRIIADRARRGPYSSLEDFLNRTACGHESADKLIRVGAFDALTPNRAETLLALDTYFHARRKMP